MVPVVVKMSGMARALDSHAHAPCPNPSLTSCRIYLHWPVFNYTTLCESKQIHVYLASVDLCYGYLRELSICQNWPADFGHPTNEKPRFCLIYIATYDKTAHLWVTFARSRSQFGRIDTLYYSMALSKDKRSQYFLTVNLGSTISFFFFILKLFSPLDLHQPEEAAVTVWDRMVFSFDFVGASLTLYSNEETLVIPK